MKACQDDSDDDGDKQKVESQAQNDSQVPSQEINPEVSQQINPETSQVETQKEISQLEPSQLISEFEENNFRPESTHADDYGENPFVNSLKDSDDLFNTQPCKFPSLAPS